MNEISQNEHIAMEKTAARRILLAVTGLSPQVVTETLYALACRSDSPWIPHEIHIVTTVTGKEHARLNLLGRDGKFGRLVSDYGLPAIALPVENIHVLADAQGNSLDDIRTPEQNALAADFMTDTVRSLTSNPASELHVSIAGGRKTMGYYLGYALSLYGRPQDRLSHVLVSEPYEGNRDFYYPTPYDLPIHTRRGDREVTVNAKDARIDLADIPFVRLRDGLPEALRIGKSSFSRVVTIANRGLEAPFLKIDVKQRKTWMDDELIDLNSTEFAFLLWLAERVKSGNSLTDISTPEMADEFIEVVGKALGTMSGDYSRIGDLLDWRKKDASLADFFRPVMSDFKKKLRDALGQGVASCGGVCYLA